MKRDLDLVRLILLEIEKNSEPEGRSIRVKVPEHSDAEISYHIGLLAEAGLVEAQNFRGDDRIEWWPMKMTWAGHEFLDAARNDTIWEKMKEMTKKAGGFAFATVFDLLIALGKQSLGL